MPGRKLKLQMSDFLVVVGLFPHRVYTELYALTDGISISIGNHMDSSAIIPKFARESMWLNSNYQTEKRQKERMEKNEDGGEILNCFNGRDGFL